MSFYIEPSTNVALPLFQFASNYQAVTFGKETSELAIFSYLDDSVTPPTGQDVKVLQNWYVCESYYLGYSYQTLNWALGTAAPQNPSCVKVKALREFV